MMRMIFIFGLEASTSPFPHVWKVLAAAVIRHVVTPLSSNRLGPGKMFPSNGAMEYLIIYLLRYVIKNYRA
jgi:hypothetical protein